MRRLLFCCACVAAAAVTQAAPALAHDPVAPAPRSEPAGEWPHGRPGARDVEVPVVFTVSATGAVEDVELERSTGDAELDARALEAARRWTFDPALRDDKPVAAKTRGVIRFAAAEEPATVHVGGGRNPPPPRSASEVVQERHVLAAAPHRTASDLLLTVPGITMTQHSGEGAAQQIFFRGFDAVHGQDVEIWAGGAPVNDVSNIHSQGYADLNFLMPEVVRRIRSSPGAYDPRQGDFAVAGSLWLDLGYDEPGVTAKATAGQFGARRFFLAYHPEGTSESTFVAAEHYATDGFGPARATTRTSAIGQAEYKLADTTTARVLASTFATSFDSAGVVRLSDVRSGRVDRFGTYDPKQGGDAARSQVVLDLTRADASSRLSIAPYVVARSMRLRQNFTGFLLLPVSGSAEAVARANAASARGNSEQQLNDATTFGLTSSYHRHVKLFAANDSFEAGVTARHDAIEQSQDKLAVDTGEVTLATLATKVRATDIASYLDVAVHPISRLTVRGGARLDGLAYSIEEATGERRSAQGMHLGKKATADVRLVSGLRAVASFGDGFRSPQARSLQQGQRSPFTTVESWEAGLRYQEARLRATAALFRTDLSDDLAFNQQTARNERTPPTRRTGFTAEMSARPTDWFSASASATFTRAEFTNTDAGYAAGDLLPYAPQLVTRTDVAWTPTLGRVFDRPLTGHLGVGGTYIGKRPLPYSELGKDAFLLDVLASVRLKEISLGVSAFNLLDLFWHDSEYTFASNFQRGAAPSLVPQRHITAGAPRTVLGTLALYL
ncbi:MAG: TonB-dependent receptor [Labilithrix sp.]|nr:TonB-dependent receptor [Labilithrix sp.]MCW5813813.1 TonB-dependent receptor [Labilithrix sp.]